MRRLLLLPLLLLVLAACGGGEEVGAVPETVEGTVTQEQLAGDAESGKALFASQGCNGCHTFEAAGSKAQVGPSLNDDLEGHAEDAGQELEPYLISSMVNPGAYIVEGYQAGIMPPYASLDRQQLADLATFIADNQ